VSKAKSSKELSKAAAAAEDDDEVDGGVCAGGTAEDTAEEPEVLEFAAAPNCASKSSGKPDGSAANELGTTVTPSEVIVLEAENTASPKVSSALSSAALAGTAGMEDGGTAKGSLSSKSAAEVGAAAVLG
jgi:hypothetical protein